MELRTSTESSTTVKSCLIAARYAGVKLNVVIDKSSTELTLGTQQGIVRGRSAVLRYACHVDRMIPDSFLVVNRPWFILLNLTVLHYSGPWFERLCRTHDARNPNDFDTVERSGRLYSRVSATNHLLWVWLSVWSLACSASRVLYYVVFHVSKFLRYSPREAPDP